MDPEAHIPALNAVQEEMGEKHLLSDHFLNMLMLLLLNERTDNRKRRMLLLDWGRTSVENSKAETASSIGGGVESIYSNSVAQRPSAGH
jgi:hypothetical protein